MYGASGRGRVWQSITKLIEHLAFHMRGFVKHIFQICIDVALLSGQTKRNLVTQSVWYELVETPTNSLHNSWSMIPGSFVQWHVHFLRSPTNSLANHGVSFPVVLFSDICIFCGGWTFSQILHFLIHWGSGGSNQDQCCPSHRSLRILAASFA